MNIEKLYASVDEDEMNSPLVSICYELECQGYTVRLEGVDVTAEELQEEKAFTDLEYSANNFNFEIIKDSVTKQKFRLVFTDYHKFSIMQAD